MKTFDDYLTEDARLTILIELTKQSDGRLNESLVAAVLEMFGHNRSREWVRTQMHKLAELGAIRLHSIDRPEADPILVAQILRAGVDHVARRTIIEGIKRPSLGS